MYKKFILPFIFILHGVIPAMSQAAPSGFYVQYWRSGELDPVRTRQWSKPDVYEDRLERIPVSPKYTLYISEGDRHNSLDYFQIHPKYEADGTLTVKPFKAHHAVVLFVDLGRAMPGTIEFEANPSAGVSISFETGEAMQPKQKYKVDTPPDGTRKKFKPQIDHAGWAGMRYVWIRFENITAPFTLYSLNGIYQIRPSNYTGNFECNDQMLNRIWEMCAYSAHCIMGQPAGNDPTPQPVLQTLCMDRVDRHPWSGDSRVIQRAVEYVFGEYELIRRANEKFMPIGIRPIPLMQTVVPYTLDWALAEIDYFRVSGDSVYFAKRLDDILAAIEEYDPYLNPKKGWYFFDWDKRIVDIKLQEQAAFTGKYIQLCREAAAAAHIAGNITAEKMLNDKAGKYSEKWKHDNPNWYNEYDIHALTNLTLGKVFTENEVQQVYEKVYSDRSRRCTNTPYFGFYILQTLAQMGKQDKGLEMIRDYWGTMIQAGATTTWEEWHPTWQLPVGVLPPQYEPPKAWSGLSLIQPSGSGPAYWLLSEIVGIKPESPGFKDVRIEPNAVDLQWVNGTAASPAGYINVEWVNSNNMFELKFDVPNVCRSVTVVVPQGREYLLDNKSITPDKLQDNKAYFIVKPHNKTMTVLN
jgi:hypothetical protein